MPKNRLIQTLMYWHCELGDLDYMDVYENFVEMLEQIVCQRDEYFYDIFGDGDRA
jgi:hypothetical protein